MGVTATRKPFEGHRSLDFQKKVAMQKLETVTAKSERKKAVEQLNVIDRTRLQIPSFDEMDNGYKRLKYVRYADDFLIGVIGSKEDCQRIKEDIKNFLEPELKFEFSDEKTLITHSQKAVKFLGYAVLANRSNLAKRDNTGRLSRVYNKKVLLRISMETIKKNLEERSKKTISVLKEDLNTVRAGRANAALLDKVMVDYYGSPTPLKNLANISTPDPRTLLIAPFDPKSISNIEKGINLANIGINPTNDGKCVRLVIPPVTEDRRKELTKTVKKMGEDSKVAIRNLRRDANDHLKKMEKSHEITEDESKKAQDDVQKMTDKVIKEIDEIIANKDKEIMEV